MANPTHPNAARRPTPKPSAGGAIQRLSLPDGGVAAWLFVVALGWGATLFADRGIVLFPVDLLTPVYGVAVLLTVLVALRSAASMRPHPGKSQPTGGAPDGG